jgi:signal transduction histidine kinase
MRATELSGVGAGQSAADSKDAHWRGVVSVLGSIPSITYAVALTAFLAATLFVVSDAVRTASETSERAALMVQAGIAQASEGVAPLAGVLERGLGAYGLAFFATGLAFRRRREDAAEVMGEPQDGYLHMLTSIREEQRVLARRYHEEKLRAEAASRSKTSFLAHLSHDIRTPLNHIIGFAELMRHETYGPLGDTRYLDYVDTIRNSGERLLSFFGSILDLAELEGGRRVLEEADLGVDDLLVATSRRFSAQAQRARVTLALGTPCGAHLCGDRFSLERMLGNLVDNAIRFTPAGGRVSIAAHAALDGVVLEISDTGIGMAPEKMSALSQPFAFGDATLTKDREGAGLGLAIARTIVELSGGHLAIDSRPGLGTTVAVSLPLLNREEPLSAAA